MLPIIMQQFVSNTIPYTITTFRAFKMKQYEGVNVIFECAATKSKITFNIPAKGTEFV